MEYIHAFIGLSILVSACGQSAISRHDLFKHRECRQRRGDVALVPTAEAPARFHPKSLKVLSRPRRLISWPEASALTIHPGLNLPFVTNNDFYQDLYLGFPLTLRLPTAPLRFSGMPRVRRSMDDQRNSSFQILEQGLETFGLPGRTCVLKAVCEIARGPLHHLGLIGEIITLIFSAGYGEGTEGMEDYLIAEIRGRREGGCEGLYRECPVGVAGFLQEGVAVFLSAFGSSGRTDR